MPLSKKTRMYEGKVHIRDMVPAPMMNRKEYLFFAGIVSMVGHLPSESIARELYLKPQVGERMVSRRLGGVGA